MIGGHTIGRARCVSFQQRIYQEMDEENYNHFQRYNTFRRILSSICPETTGDQRIAPLDYATPLEFDNEYFINLLQGKGLLHSDNVLVDEDHEGEIRWLVWTYARNPNTFFKDFARSIVKMGNINVLTGFQGEIRKNCRFVNV